MAGSWVSKWSQRDGSCVNVDLYVLNQTLYLVHSTGNVGKWNGSSWTACSAQDSTTVRNNGTKATSSYTSCVPKPTTAATPTSGTLDSNEYISISSGTYMGTWALTRSSNDEHDFVKLSYWNLPRYTITVNGNGGGTTSGGGKYWEGTSVTLRATPNTHYHFVKWSDNNTSASRTITVTANATYTATFAIDTHTITVKSGGNGTVSGGGTYNYGSQTTIKATPNTGYKFVKWSDNSTSASRTITVKSNATYTARFAAITYYIAYNGNKATSGSMSNSTHTFDVAKQLNSNAFVKLGYGFSYWLSDSKVRCADMALVKNLAATNGATVTLYAQWTVKDFVLNFNANGGSVNPINKWVTFGQKYGTLPTPTRDGYRFDGWFTKASGGDAVTENSIMEAEGATIYAHWTAYTITLTYDPNGGIISDSPHKFNDTTYFKINNDKVQSASSSTGIYSDVTAIIDTSTTYVNLWDITSFNVTRTGYTIGSTDGYICDGVPLNQNDSATNTINKVTVNNINRGVALTDNINKTIQVNWKPRTYVITLDKNEGTGGSDSVVATYDAAMPTDGVTAPARNGYNFQGYYDAESGGIQYYTSTMSSERAWNKAENTTLYAHWALKPDAKIIFNMSGLQGPVKNELSYNVTHPSITCGSLTAPNNIPNGYEFIGWSSSEEDAKNGIVYPDSTIIYVQGNEPDTKTLYACWKCVITFEARDVPAGAQAPASITKKGFYSQAITSPTKEEFPIEGFRVTAWTDDSTTVNPGENVKIAGTYDCSKTYYTNDWQDYNTPYAEFDSTDGSLTFFNAQEGTYINGQVDGTKTYYTVANTGSSPDVPPWADDNLAGDKRLLITKVIFKETISVKSLWHWFYGCAILETIECKVNLPINFITGPESNPSMSACFYNCSSLTTAPIIPSNITNMDSCFRGCESLTTAPTIPSSVTYMSFCFYGCSSLTTAPTIPSNVTNMIYCFYDCTSLTTAPTIPSSVTNINSCFYNCSSLTTAPTILGNITNMDSCFRGCESLTTAPTIPSSVTYMGFCFYGCSSLTTAPTIPSSVTNINSCFRRCSSLSGNITINNNPTNYNNAFSYTSQDIFIVRGGNYAQGEDATTVATKWRTIASGYLNVHFEADDNPKPMAGNIDLERGIAGWELQWSSDEIRHNQYSVTPNGDIPMGKLTSNYPAIYVGPSEQLTQWYFDYWDGSYLYKDSFISYADYIPASNSYSGMNPEPTFAPQKSGDKYYINIISSDEDLAGTWAWVRDETTTYLYKWKGSPFNSAYEDGTGIKITLKSVDITVRDMQGAVLPDGNSWDNNFEQLEVYIDNNNIDSSSIRPTDSNPYTLIYDTGDTLRHIIKIVVTDEIGNIGIRTVVFPSVFATLDFKSGGEGIAIGGFAKRNGLTIQMPTYIGKNLLGRTMTVINSIDLYKYNNNNWEPYRLEEDQELKVSYPPYNDSGNEVKLIFNNSNGTTRFFLNPRGYIGLINAYHVYINNVSLENKDTAETIDPTKIYYARHQSDNNWIDINNQQLIIGQYNKIIGSENSLVIVGNGTSNNDRKNCLEIDSNGNLIVSGNITTNNQTINNTKADDMTVIKGGRSNSVDFVSGAYIGMHSSNKTFNLPSSAITIESSTDGGNTWNTYTSIAANKAAVFSETRAYNCYLGAHTTAGTNTTNDRLRFTIEPTDRYVRVFGIYVWGSTNGNTFVMDLERSTIGAPDTFTTVFTGHPIQGWSGPNIKYFTAGTFGGGSTQTSNNYKYRITFRQTAVNTNYASACVSDIRFLGDAVWGTPPNNMVLTNHLYSWDTDLNAKFPAGIMGRNHLTSIGTIKEGWASSNINLTANTATKVAQVTLDAGTWIVNVGVRFASNANGYRMVNISSTSGSGDYNYTVTPVDGQMTQVVFSKVITVTTQTVYYLNAYSTVAVTVNSGGSNWGTYMKAVQII